MAARSDIEHLSADGTDTTGNPREMHGHLHEHDEEPPHRHPHHHGPDSHDHAHTTGYERYTYLVSPIHDLDPRFKVVAALIMIVGTVAGPVLRPLELALVVVFLAALIVISGVPLRWIAGRAALVLPIALGIAIFAPLGRAESFSWTGIVSAYADNSWLIWAILSKAWISAAIVLVVSATTPLSRLLKALEALRLPDIFLTLLTFLYRFTDLFAEQLRSMQRSVAGRAPNLRGLSLVRLYGNLAGNLFIRAYERGDRVYSAMVSRGYTGVMPTAEQFHAAPSDYLAVVISILVVSALLLY